MTERRKCCWSTIWRTKHSFSWIGQACQFARNKYGLILMTPEQRLEPFEVMMKQIKADFEQEKTLMDDLQTRGKEKSAACRQYMGKRLMHTRFLAIYKAYGLWD